MDRYGNDVLAGDWRKPQLGRATPLPVELELVVEDVVNGFVGEIVAIFTDTVELEDRHGKRRIVRMGPGYWVDGKPVELVPATIAVAKPTRSASGSVRVDGTRAQVAKASRLLVEGRHDADLVEKVWGHDLRIEGVVVEILEGVDNLAEVVEQFAPSPERRLGVLVDHLVPGSKESRIAAAYDRDPDVLVVGHPFVDVWQSVKPSSLGIDAWPTIPRNIEWKRGICASFGWPHETRADIANAWQRILATVDDFTDLEPELLGRVEELIDFVTV